jgi:hypothetical protein
LESKADDHANTSSGSTSLTTIAEGILHQADDIDFFYINISTPRTITATPFCLGSEVGANLKMQMKIYSNRALVATISSTGSLQATTTLSPGKYFVSVESVETEFTTRYGMLGKYKLTLE